MSAVAQVTVAELQDLLRSLQLPTDMRLTLTFEDNSIVQDALRRQKAMSAMKKLRGSGNGKLVHALLKEREKEARL